MKKRRIAAVIAAVITISLFSGCAAKNAASDGEGSVYYLNFKPEQDQQWQDLAKAYTDETGINVKVVTAAAGTYEETLTSELGKTGAPTMFQVNGPMGLDTWQDYCYDLSGSKVLGELTSDEFALRNSSGSVLAMAYVIETYGLIYNKALLEKAGYSQDDITNFDTLKSVVQDITARKDTLGFSAFAAPGMDASSDWRFKTHLANIPVYYEYKKDGIGQTTAIKGTYLDEYKDIWDLYINNSTCKPSELSAKTIDDAVSDFVTGKAVFYQDGTWAYDDIKKLGDENIGMLPIYIGVEGEENQGLCTGSENYWCVNKDASKADIQATLDFMYWVVTSETGTNSLANEMKFVCPFKAAKASSNPLVKIAGQYVTDGRIPVDWCFPTMPSDEWKNSLGSALTAYAAGTGTWDAVKVAFVDGWKTEYSLNHSDALKS